MLLSLPQGIGLTSAGTKTTAIANENITVTGVFATVFTVDIKDSGDAVLNLRNTSAVSNLEYKIFATPKEVDILPIDSDDSWTNIIDLSADPQNFNIDANKTIPTQTTFYESLSNKFRWFRVEMRSTGPNLTAKIWFRGREQK